MEAARGGGNIGGAAEAASDEQVVLDAVRQLRGGCRHLDLHFYGLSAAPRAGEGEGGAEAAAPALSALARIVACCFDAERLTIVDLSLNPLEPLGVAQVALLLLGGGGGGGAALDDPEEEAERSLLQGDVCESLAGLDLEPEPALLAQARALLRPSPVRCRLKVLILTHCRGGPEGCSAVAAALAHNRSLVELELGGNGAGVKAGRLLARAVERHPRLRALRVRCNALGASVADLAAAAEASKTLTCLDLRENRVPAAAARRLAEALPSSRLTDVDLRGNDLEDDAPGREGLDATEAAFAAAVLAAPALTRLQFTRFELSLGLYRRLAAHVLAAGAGPPELAALRDKVLTSFQQQHFVPRHCARRWSEAYSAGLALPGCPLELAEPSAPMQAAVLVDYFDFVLREPLE